MSIVLLAALCFAAGGAAGVVAYREVAARAPREPLSARKGASWKTDQVERWSHALQLDALQKKRLEGAIDSVYDRYRQLYAEVEAKKRSIDADLREAVTPILSAKQRARYEETLAEGEARRRAYYGAIDPSAIAKPIQPAKAADDR
jgi:hypothetical protein